MLCGIPIVQIQTGIVSFPCVFAKTFKRWCAPLRPQRFSLQNGEGHSTYTNSFTTLGRSKDFFELGALCCGFVHAHGTSPCIFRWRSICALQLLKLESWLVTHPNHDPKYTLFAQRSAFLRPHPAELPSEVPKEL